MKTAKQKYLRVLTSQQLRQTLNRFCRDILRQHSRLESLVLIGIRTRGLYIARRLSEIVDKATGKQIQVGEIDITLYRDDLNALLPGGKVGGTQIPFDISGKTLILVDDVLNTGRTVRAAVDHLIDLGRPRIIHLAVLVDRGGRELPIAANFVGKKINVPNNGEVQVHLKEVDGKDEVIVKR